jgi:tetratricopeptide (TPR) repeat protein
VTTRRPANFIYEESKVRLYAQRLENRDDLLWIHFFAYTALPCLWITGTKYSGERVTTEGFSDAEMLRRSFQMDRRPDGAKMEADLRGATDFNDRSDYSVALMFLGRSREAVELLQELEKEKPGHYFIAANLGTAYELSGNNEEALRWIQEGIRRNPDSHEGTEWLHVKVLGAKIARQKDSHYFETHSVLQLRPEKIGEQIIVGEQKLSPKQLADAIQYQLAERLQFVKPPDPAVASLLFDYAAIEAATKTLELAKEILQMTIEYGYPPEKVQALMKLYDRRIFWGKAKRYGLHVLKYGFCAVIGVLVICGLYWSSKRGYFVLSSRDLKPR